MKFPDPATYRDRVRDAVREDGAAADVTVAFLGIDAGVAVTAEVRAGADIVVCGVDVIRETFCQTHPALQVSPCIGDSERAGRGDVIARVQGPAPFVLGAERVALNFAQRLSGIATLTSQFVAAVAGTGVTILDTRKTTPLWRDLEKYAVRCGGGCNHRMDLTDMVLVKENHVRACGGMAAIVSRLRARSGNSPFVEVEVDSLGALEALIDAGVLGESVDRVMLDNFDPGEIATATAMLSANSARDSFQVEISGGITLATVADYALPGVDFISVGALTHSAPSATMSLEVVAR